MSAPSGRATRSRSITTVRAVRTPGRSRKPSELASRPVFITARGSLRTGTFAAAVGVPNRVEDEVMRRQRLLPVEMVDDRDGGLKARVVQQQRGRDVAAAGGDELQQ